MSRVPDGIHKYNEWLFNNAHNSCKPRIREVPDSNSPGNTHKTNNNRYSPLNSVNAARLNLESITSNDNNYNLQINDKSTYANKVGVAVDAFKHIKLVVKSLVIKDVKDLHLEEGVKDNSFKLKPLVLVGEAVAENVATSEVEDEDGGKLVDVLMYNLLLRLRIIVS
jgi:hypothetical protein